MTEIDSNKITEIRNKCRGSTGDTWIKVLNDENPLIISSIISELYYPKGKSTEHFSSIREGAKALLDSKLNENLIKP